jgi:hypothetical protein
MYWTNQRGVHGLEPPAERRMGVGSYQTIASATVILLSVEQQTGSCFLKSLKNLLPNISYTNQS